MEGRGRRAIRTALAVLSVLTVVAAALVFEGILHRSSGGRWPWFFGASVNQTGSATLTYATRYTRCGDVVSSSVEMPEVELSSALQALEGGWTVVESGDGFARAEKQTDGYCPEHEDFRLISLYRGGPAGKPHVCVFRGRKADPAFISKERRDLTEDLLYPQDRERLRAGILLTREPGDAPDLDLDEKAAAYLQGIGEGR